MKRAFLVLGPESSGTRLMTQILITAGCFGDSEHDQRLDDNHFRADCDEPLIVWRRSLPHRGAWPDVAEHVSGLRALGYRVTAVVMSRDWHAMVDSQTGQHTESTETAMANIRHAYPRIFVGLGSCQYELVNYEALTTRPNQTIPALLRRLGLPYPESLPYVYDGNARHYETELEPFRQWVAYDFRE